MVWKTRVQETTNPKLYQLASTPWQFRHDFIPSKYSDIFI